jgi:hypothetical protein
MRYRIFIQSIFIISTVLLIFSACKKVAIPEPLGDKGITIVKFSDALADTASGHASGYKIVNIDLVSTPQTFEVVDIRRDVPNNAELNKDMNIVVQIDPGAVTSFNPDLTPLPDGSFSTDPSVTLVGKDMQVIMKAGEFSKIINITIQNILALDISKTYALGFTISSADANGQISKLEKSMVVELGLKNKWDGKYQVNTNSFVDYVNPALIAYNSWLAELHTSGPHKAVAYLTGVIGSPDLATTDWLNTPYHPIINTTNAAGSVYGNYGMEFEFDDADKIIKVVNVYGQPTTTSPYRSAELDPGGANQVFSNKDFRVKYKLIQTGLSPAPPGDIRVLMDETWVYKGPR